MGLTEAEWRDAVELALGEIARLLGMDVLDPSRCPGLTTIANFRAECEAVREEMARANAPRDLAKELDAAYAEAARKQQADLERFNAERAALGLRPAASFEEAVRMGNRNTNPRAWKRAPS